MAKTANAKAPISRRIVDEVMGAEILAKAKAREQEKIKEASRILRLAGCETRLRILLFLERVNSGASEIRAEIGGLTDQAISYQCSQLVVGGLVSRESRGKAVIYSLTPLGKKIAGLIKGMKS